MNVAATVTKSPSLCVKELTVSANGLENQNDNLGFYLIRYVDFSYSLCFFKPMATGVSDKRRKNCYYSQPMTNSWVCNIRVGGILVT